MHPDPARLAQFDLFQGLSADEFALLASWFDVEEFGPGQRLVHEGVSGYAFFVLDQGRVRVEQDGDVLVTLEPGAVFGEMAFYGDGRRNADVVAETEGRALAMFGTRYREMQAGMPDVAERLQDLAHQRAS